MKKVIFLCISGLLVYASASAQSTVDKTVNTVNGGVVKAENAKNTINKIKGWLPKKKKKDEPATTSPEATVVIKDVPKADSVVQATSKNTQISIAGINYTKLKKLNENIQACEGVQSTKLKFGVELSTIEVMHSGTTEKLLQLMQATSADIFTSKQLQGIEEGKISIKI